MYISKTPAAWHRRTTQFGTSCLSFAAVSSCWVAYKRRTHNEQERMGMRMCANKNDANKTYQTVNQSMVFMISAGKGCSK